MARNQCKRLPPAKVEADESGFAALQTIQGYTPINPACMLDAVRNAHVELDEVRRAEAAAAAGAATARDKAVAKEWEFHNLMLGVKDQVIAQFGKDSDEVAALGLKRKSEYKAPMRRSRRSIDTG